MQKQKTIKKNVYFVAIGRLIHIALAFILIPFAARWLGNDGFGKYSLAMAIMYMIFILNDLGLITYLTREISRNKENATQYFVNALYLKMIFIVFNLIVLFVFLRFTDYDGDTKKIIIILGIYGIISSIAQLCFSIFRAFERMQYETIIVILEKFVITSLGITLLLLGFGLVPFGFIFLIAGLISIATGLYFLKSKFQIIHSFFDFTLAKNLLIHSIPFGASMLLVTIYDKIDTVMLSMMQTMSDVGWYSTAYRLLAITGVVPTILVTAIFPKMSQDILNNKEEVSRLFTKSFKYLFLLAVPLVALGVLVGDKIILFVFSDEYQNSIVVFQILVWAAGILFINILLGSLFRASDRQKLLVRVQSAGVIINIVLNFILIPIYSYKGAAIATVITESMICIVCLTYTIYNICKLTEIMFIFKAFTAVMLMTFIVLLVKDLNLFLIIGIAGLLYFGVLYLLKAFTFQEILLIRQET